MREFRCASLGNNCTWKHIAKTEELLADVTALHLRDVHGMNALTPDIVGKVKNLFSNPSPVDEEKAEGLVLKEFRCQDIGQKCSWKYIAQTEELIADGVAVHAREAHGITEFSPEMMTRVKNSVHEWKG
jgi:predicted small metal-binding protein